MIRKRRSAKLIAMFMSLIMALTIFGVNTSVIFAEGDDSPGDTIANEEIINDGPEEQTEENESETIPEEEQMPEIEAVPGVEAQIQAEGDPEAVFENLPYTHGEVLYPGVTCRVGTWALNAPEGTDYTFDWNITFEKLEEGDDEPEYVLIDDPSEYVQWQEVSEEDQSDNYSLMDFFALENICPGRVGVQVDVYFDDETEPACSTTKEYIVTDAEPEFQLQLCPYTDAILGETKDLEVELFYDGEDVTKKSTFEWSFKYGHWVGDDETEYWEELENTGNKYFSDTAGATSNKHSVTVANSIPEDELGVIDVGVTAYYKGEEVVVDPELGAIWVSNERYEISATFNGETTTRPYLMLGENNLTLTTKKYEVGKNPVVVPVTGDLQYQWLDDEWNPLPADGDITVTGSGSSYVVTKNTANDICFGVELVDTSLPEEEGWLTETDFYAMDNWPTICMVNSEGEYEAPDTDWDESFGINWYKPTNFQLVEDYDNGEFGNYTNLGVDWAVLVENDDGAGFVEDPDFANIVVDESDSTKIQLTTKKDDDFYLAAFPEGTEEYTPDNAFYFMCMYSEGEETFKITSRTIKDDDNAPVSKSSLNVKEGSEITLTVTAELLDVEGPDPERNISYSWYRDGNDGETLIEGETGNSFSFTAKNGTEEDPGTWGSYKCYVSDGCDKIYATFLISDGNLNVYPIPAENPTYGHSKVELDPTQSETAKLKVDVTYAGELGQGETIKYKWKHDFETISEGVIDSTNMSTILELEQDDDNNIGSYQCEVGIYNDEELTGECEVALFEVAMKQTLTIKAPSDYDEDDDIDVTLQMDNNNNVISQQGYVLAESSAVASSDISYSWKYYTSYDDDAEETDLPSGTNCTFDKEGIYVCDVSDGYSNVSILFNVSTNSGLIVEKDYYNYSFDWNDPELQNDFELKAVASSARKLPVTYSWYAWTYSEKIPIEGETGNTCIVSLGYPILSYTCEVSDGYHTEYIIYEIDIDSGLVVYNEEERYDYDYTKGEVEPETTFKVVAESDATDTLGYEWYKEDYETYEIEPIEGETGSELTVSNRTENTGCYVCLVNDGFNVRQVGFDLNVTGISLSDVEIKLNSDSFTYTGQEIEPTVSATLGGETLAKGTDYTVSYDNNINVSSYEAEVIITGIGKYQGTWDTRFAITKANGNINTPPTAKSLSYTGGALELINAGAGTGDLWYIVTETPTKPDNDDSGWSKNIPKQTDQGTYYVWYKLTGDENHTDVDVAADSYVEVTIGKVAATVTAPTKKTGLTYNESAMDLINAGSATGGTINYLVTDTTKTAPEGTWAEAIPTGTNAGDYRVWYKAIGDKNHSDSEPGYVDVTITKADPTFPELGALSGTCLQTLADVDLSNNQCKWQNEEETLGTGRSKAANVVFTPTDTENYNVITKPITVTVIHEHSEHVSDPAGYMKNGYDLETCKDCGTTLVNQFLAGYGTPNVKSFKVKKGKKSFTAKWKKAKKNNLKLTSGYQILYSNNPWMVGAATTYAGAKAKSKKVKGLAKKATYYVQMRAYYNTSTGPVYSSWTAVKKVTTK